MTSRKKFCFVTQIILQIWSCDQSLVTLASLGEKLSQPQFYEDLTRETTFLEGWSWFKFKNLRLRLGIALKFYTSVAKTLKIKVRKFSGEVSTFVKVRGEKRVVGLKLGSLFRYIKNFWKSGIKACFISSILLVLGELCNLLEYCLSVRLQKGCFKWKNFFVETMFQHVFPKVQFWVHYFFSFK